MKVIVQVGCMFLNDIKKLYFIKEVIRWKG